MIVFAFVPYLRGLLGAHCLSQFVNLASQGDPGGTGRAMQSLLSSFLRTVFFTICFVVQCFCLETRNFNCLSNTPDGRWQAWV
jgi:hypothetical protein